MPTWNADQYLRFADERTQPSRDLAWRIAVPSPHRIVDLGCGPGNSTAVLAERWPDADIEGIDSSPAMIAAARRDYPEWRWPNQRWTVGDVSAWAGNEGQQFDLVFSNATLQWVPDHESLYPALLRRVVAGGALAIQVPFNLEAPAQTIMRTLASSPAWASLLPAGGVRAWHVHDEGFYYDILARQAARLEIWITEYLHIMDGPAAIVAWYQGTGMRPFLDALPTDDDRARFMAEYGERIAEAYTARQDGRVLFPFRRMFIIAYR
jgi:trans-aconitate 2-methyltransferase